MASKEDGKTSKEKVSYKSSKTQATGPSTVAGTSLPRLAMDVSNYIALLKTQVQPQEVGVIFEYLQKCPLTYPLLTTSPTPQSLISDVFQSVAISLRAKSKKLDVEFNLCRTNLVLTKEEFAISLGLSDCLCKPSTFVTTSSAQLLTMFKEMRYKFKEKVEPNLSRIKKARLPTPWHFLSFVLTRCFSDLLVDAVVVKEIFGLSCMDFSMISMSTTCPLFGKTSSPLFLPQKISF
ncbi:unnamed protein product [Lactuca virosa]|uniref:Uncharacterized protein n=1 Tax=Lactuca virosa TaxID=75947 RepID=A0AAU9LML1_9ASTR|nr:unnamed protein product [Lactuca virosa]